MIETLDKQKMEAMRELVTISSNLNTARVELDNLLKQKDSFIKSREDEVIARINEVLEHSRGIITEISENYTQLRSYRSQVEEFSKKVLVFSEDLNETSSQMAKSAEDTRTELDRVHKNLLNAQEETKKQNIVIQAEKEALKARRKLLDNDAAHIKSQRIQLEATLQAIKRLQK